MLIWYVAGAVAAIAVGWLSSLVHASGHAPIGLVSLSVGVVLGAILAKLAANQRITGRRQLIIGAISIAILTILAEHTWLYLDFCRQWKTSREKSPQVAMFRPENPPSPRDYFANEWSAKTAAIWISDAVIIIASTFATFWILTPATRVPDPRPLTPDPSR